MQALLRASRRLDNARIAVAFPDSLPTLLGVVECLPTLSLIGSHLGRLHTAAGAIDSAARGKSCLNLSVEHILAPQCLISNRSQIAPPSAVVPFNPATTASAQPKNVSTPKQHLMALQAHLMKQNVISMKDYRDLWRSGSIILPSKHCGLLQEHSGPGSNDQDAVDDANVWQADSVRRKRKKKMNKHKHSKRRKLTRHKR